MTKARTPKLPYAPPIKRDRRETAPRKDVPLAFLAKQELQIDLATGSICLPFEFGYDKRMHARHSPSGEAFFDICRRSFKSEIFPFSDSRHAPSGVEIFQRMLANDDYSAPKEEIANLRHPSLAPFVYETWGPTKEADNDNREKRVWVDTFSGDCRKIRELLEKRKAAGYAFPHKIIAADVADNLKLAQTNICSTGFPADRFEFLRVDVMSSAFTERMQALASDLHVSITSSNLGYTFNNPRTEAIHAYLQLQRRFLRPADPLYNRGPDALVLGISETRNEPFLFKDYLKNKQLYEVFAVATWLHFCEVAEITNADHSAITVEMRSKIAERDRLEVVLHNSRNQWLHSAHGEPIFLSKGDINIIFMNRRPHIVTQQDLFMANDYAWDRFARPASAHPSGIDIAQAAFYRLRAPEPGLRVYDFGLSKIMPPPVRNPVASPPVFPDGLAC